MQITKRPLHRETKRDSYWTQVTLESGSNKKTDLFLCASHEYLENVGVLVNNRIDDGWVDSVVEEWSSNSQRAFKNTVHIEVYALTADGKKNGEKFLKNDVIPEVFTSRTTQQINL